MANVDGSITVADSAIGVTIPAGLEPRVMTFSVEEADIRYRVSGTDPTAGVGGGHLVADGTYVTLNGRDNIEKLSMIRNAGVNATVFYTLEK
jgi:hypothetical protein